MRRPTKGKGGLKHGSYLDQATEVLAEATHHDNPVIDKLDQGRAQLAHIVESREELPRGQVHHKRVKQLGSHAANVHQDSRGPAGHSIGYKHRIEVAVHKPVERIPHANGGVVDGPEDEEEEKRRLEGPSCAEGGVNKGT